MNYMDMIHDLYSGTEAHATGDTLYQNKNHLGMVQGHKSPFHHKEEVALRAFDARVTAAYYATVRESWPAFDVEKVDEYIIRSGREAFCKKVTAIRKLLFDAKVQSPLTPYPSAETSENTEMISHARFLQQMEVYKTLKHSIKHADIGIIRRILARCCILFQGASKVKYASLAFYMTWLTQTNATDPELQRAILANGLVNLQGRPDSWFEMDRLNEFLNLQMKIVMATRRTSTAEIRDIITRTALFANYCTDLCVILESQFGEVSNGRHKAKNAVYDVRGLAYYLYRNGSITTAKVPPLSHSIPPDIVRQGVQTLAAAIKRFNDRTIRGD